MRELSYIFASVLSIILCGCASNQMTQSGHLADYGKLRPTDDSGVSLFGRVDFEPSAFRGNSARLRDVPDDAKKVLTQHLDQRIRERVAASPKSSGERSLLVRAVITDFDQPNRLLNVVSTFAVGPVSTGGATLEISVTDQLNREEVISMVCAEKANAVSWTGFTNAYSALGHAKAAIDDCLGRFAKVLNRVR
jgi:hypothetical protein